MDLKVSPLDMAHANDRKAEKLTNSGRFLDAVDCRKHAIDLLEQVFKVTNHPEVHNSLQAQVDDHRRKIKLLERWHKQREELAKRREEEEKAQALLLENLKLTEGEQLSDAAQNAVQTIEDCDSLLIMLNQRAGREDPRQHERVLGTKTPKDDTMVIEELRQQNEDLRQHIMQLLLDNESKACHISSLFAENTHLHKKVTELESSHQSTDDVNKSALTENESETSSTPENEVTEKLGTSSRPVSELSHLWNAEDKQFFEQLYAQPDANLPPLNLPKFD